MFRSIISFFTSTVKLVLPIYSQMPQTRLHRNNTSLEHDHFRCYHNWNPWKQATAVCFSTFQKVFNNSFPADVRHTFLPFHHPPLKASKNPLCHQYIFFIFPTDISKKICYNYHIYLFRKHSNVVSNVNLYNHFRPKTQTKETIANVFPPKAKKETDKWIKST